MFWMVCKGGGNAQTISSGWCRTGKRLMMPIYAFPHHSSLSVNPVLFWKTEEAAFFNMLLWCSTSSLTLRRLSWSPVYSSKKVTRSFLNPRMCVCLTCELWCLSKYQMLLAQSFLNMTFGSFCLLPPLLLLPKLVSEISWVGFVLCPTPD